MMWLYFEYWPWIFLVILLSLAALGWRVRSDYVWRAWDLSSMRSWEVSVMKFWFRQSLLLVMIGALGLAVLRPVWGSGWTREGEQGLDVMFVLDVSKSMKALDLSEGPQKVDRLSMAKKIIEFFVYQRPTDRVGLVIFSGEAVVISPLTLDRNLFLTYLESVSTDDIAIGGTNLTESISLGVERLTIDREDAQSRIMVLLSDGEETLDSEVALWAQRSGERGVPIFTIGVGTHEGVPIPDGIDIFGDIRYKVYQGQTVLTKINEATLQSIADLSGGIYASADSLRAVKSIVNRLGSLPQEVRWKDGKVEGQGERYLLFVSIGLVAFLLYAFGKEGRKKIFIIALSFWITGCQAPGNTMFRYYNHQGVEAFKAQDLKQARQYFQQSRHYLRDNQLIPDNQEGLIRYEEEDYQGAESIWREAIDRYCFEAGVPYCEYLHYHLGNALYRQSEAEECFEDKIPFLESALEAYAKGLEIKSGDPDIVNNRSFIKTLLEHPPEESCEGDGEGDGDQEGEGEGDDDKTSSDDPKSNSPEENEDQEDPSQDPKDDAQDPEDGSDSAQDPQGGDQESSPENPSGESESGNNPTSPHGGPEKGEDPYEIPPDLQQQIQDYEQEMNQIQDQLRDHFSRLKSQRGRQNAPFANDPFFSEFFDGTFPIEQMLDEFLGEPTEKGTGQRRPVEKDW